MFPAQQISIIEWKDNGLDLLSLMSTWLDIYGTHTDVSPTTSNLPNGKVFILPGNLIVEVSSVVNINLSGQCLITHFNPTLSTNHVDNSQKSIKIVNPYKVNVNLIR